MKTLLLIFLLLPFAAMAQTLPRQQKEIMEEENMELKEDEKPSQLKAVSDTLKHAGKEILKDSLASKQKMIGILDIKIDSATTGKAKQQIKTTALDSLKNQNLLKENDYLQETLNISIDPATSKRVKQQLKSVVTDSLNNQKFLKENGYLQEVLNMPVDSAPTDKVKEQLKSIAFDSLNNQKFIKENEYIGDIKELEQLREIPKDSLGGYVKEELSERGEQFLKNTDEYKEFTGMEDGFILIQ